MYVRPCAAVVLNRVDRPLTFSSDYDQSPLDNERRSKFSASVFGCPENGNKPKRNFDYPWPFVNVGPPVLKARKTDKLWFICVLIEIGVRRPHKRNLDALRSTYLTFTWIQKQIDWYLWLRFFFFVSCILIPSFFSQN